jgi:crotonobetainyl-CoA:carnitine CoA-transferase CaiB-like acyl-CoA transferase
MSGPLSGIRVVDFSRVLAGPLCARTLLDLGAEVIKIEPPPPDVSRFAFPSTPGMSGYYAQQNAGKRDVSIDLNVPGARELALRLCDTADVVVENFRAGALRYFGLDYQTLAARNPRLIYASITGYGQGGPWQGRMAYAPTVQAEAGFTHNSLRHYGEVLGEPRTDSLSHADVYAGLQAAVAILAALHRRETTGTGQYIDVAMAATLMAVNERAHVDLNDAELGAEPGILGATDCPFFIGPGGEHFTVATSLVGSCTFPSWLRAMRRADLADDPRFATAAARRTNFAELHRIVQNWILTFADVGALDAQLDEAKIAFGDVRSLKQLSEMEWAEYWDAVQEVSDRNGGRYRLPGRPWRSRANGLRHSVSPPIRVSTTAPSLLSWVSATTKSTPMSSPARLSARQFLNPQTRGTRYDPLSRCHQWPPLCGGRFKLPCADGGKADQPDLRPASGRAALDRRHRGPSHDDL